MAYTVISMHITVLIFCSPDQWIRVPLALVRKPPIKVKRVFECRDKDDIEVIPPLYFVALDDGRS